WYGPRLRPAKDSCRSSQTDAPRERPSADARERWACGYTTTSSFVFQARNRRLCEYPTQRCAEGVRPSSRSATVPSQRRAYCATERFLTLSVHRSSLRPFPDTRTCARTRFAAARFGRRDRLLDSPPPGSTTDRSG